MEETSFGFIQEDTRCKVRKTRSESEEKIKSRKAAQLGRKWRGNRERERGRERESERESAEVYARGEDVISMGEGAYDTRVPRVTCVASVESKSNLLSAMCDTPASDILVYTPSPVTPHPLDDMGMPYHTYTSLPPLNMTNRKNHDCDFFFSASSSNSACL